MRKKLTGSKKIYALNLNLALNLNGFDVSYLNDSRVYGRYFENYVFMRLSEKCKKVEYYRVAGKELDFVTESGAFEIKSGKDIDGEKYEDIAKKLKKEFFLIAEEEGYLM